MTWTALTHLSYLALTVPLTIWVASALSRDGQVFLADVFGQKADLARAVNRLLVVGFYLLNLGFVMLFLRFGNDVVDSTGALETLSLKVGIVMLVLGAVHFLNVWFFNTIRRRTRLEQLHDAPVRPQRYLPPNQPPAPASH